jgi:predicted transcriptional regulator
MQTVARDIRHLVPRGTVTALAKKLGITPQAVSIALKAGRPNHPAVQAALALAEDSGTLATALKLANLTPTV